MNIAFKNRYRITCFVRGNDSLLPNKRKDHILWYYFDCILRYKVFATFLCDILCLFFQYGIFLSVLILLIWDVFSFNCPSIILYLFILSFSN